MPELPEVETVLRTLEGMIKGNKIEAIDVLYAPIIQDDLTLFKNSLIGKSFLGFKRRGKYLIFELDDLALVVHLRMEGKFFVSESDEPINKHIHIVFHLSNGKELRYQDTRKFGRMHLQPLGDYCVFHNLGVEPFDSAFNHAYVRSFLNTKHQAIKTVLLDQSFIAGIGNIYADEILFMMKVNPQRRANELSDRNIEDLIFYTKKILLEAIKEGGTTIRSYTSSLGVTGRFQQNLKVHQREGEPCYDCGTPVVKTKVNGRGTYYCPRCQKD